MSIPFGYTHVSSARDMQMGRKYLNFIAIVLDVRPPRETKHGFTTSFTISDTQDDPYSGLPIRFFRSSTALDGLPPVEAGDIILLRSILVGEYMQAVSGVVPQYVTCPWVIFRRDPYSQSLLRIAESSRRHIVTPGEHVYINTIAGISNAANPLGVNKPPVPPGHSYPPAQPLHATPVARLPPAPQPTRSAPSKSTKKDKFSLLANIRDFTFVDLAGYVVRMSSGPPGGCLVYITDYTENDALDDYSDNDNETGDWPGPYGRRTFKITLWDDNAEWASENVHDNDIIRLFNVNVKERNGFLEGRLHSEASGKLKIDLVDSSDQGDERISQLAQRKNEYWKKRKLELREIQEKKSTAASNSVAEKRKARKKAQQQKDLEAKRRKRDEDQPEINNAIQSTSAKKRETLNQNVEAWNPSQRIYSLRDIIDNDYHDNTTPDGIKYRLPFQNVRYRTTVRVVDYLPHRLEDFSIRCSTDRQFMEDKHSHEAETPGNDDASEDEFDTHSSSSWVWRFCLLVEDATEKPPTGSRRPRIPLFVSDQDAEHLLCLDAKDLRQDEHALEALRNKFFLLWGNLQELKDDLMTRNGAFDPESSTASLKSLPFTCCIKEYGVRVADISVKEAENGEPLLDLGWKRRFRMFGTKIMGL